MPQRRRGERETTIEPKKTFGRDFLLLLLFAGNKRLKRCVLRDIRQVALADFLGKGEVNIRWQLGLYTAKGGGFPAFTFTLPFMSLWTTENEAEPSTSASHRTASCQKELGNAQSNGNVP